MCAFTTFFSVDTIRADNRWFEFSDTYILCSATANRSPRNHGLNGAANEQYSLLYEI